MFLSPTLVPPKPPHLQSPVTALSSPFTCSQKLPFKSAMDEGREGAGGAGGVRGGSREKHSKVSDLISRFEENRWVCLQQQVEVLHWVSSSLQLLLQPSSEH